MCWSTISRTGRHFYFNYHYVESALPYIHSSFTRRVQFAFQMVISFLVGGFLVYGTPLNDHLALKFLIPIISVLSIQDTFGLTLAGALQGLLANVLTTIFFFVVQKIGLGYQDYLAAELILLVSSFFIAFICSQAQTRKIPLLSCAIFFSAIVNQPALPSTFIFQLFEEVVIGMAVAVLVSFTIFPVFATIDIENRVNYCLLNLQEMQTSIIQAFLCQDQMSAQVSLTRASTLEEMIRLAMRPIHMKLTAARFEPSRCLQHIFNRRRRHIIDLTVQEQEDLVILWLLHIRSMQSMVKQCQFNEYHSDLTRKLETSLLQVCSCQSIIISALTTPPSITKDEFIRRVSNLDHAGEALRSAYKEVRFQRVEYALESATHIQSEDHLAHAFFLFQLCIIVRHFAQLTMTNVKKPVPEKTKKSLKERLTPKWSRFFSATKSMIIIGVGSIFVMVPTLAKAFENGQWIFIAICMTQADSVGGAFIAMKMRLFGTLLGAMWAYVTYLSVGDNVYQTFGMLVPWILVCGYLRPLQNWGYTGVLATSTAILINLGRLPYGNAMPAGNYALLRIEENLVGIGVAIVLTIIIFPVFAIDLLKDNIQNTLQTCRDSVDSMISIYNQLFVHEQLSEVSIDIEKQEQNIKSFFDTQRNHFHQLIIIQQTLIEHASAEPSFWWFNNNFSTDRYRALVQQELDILQILHNIDTALMRVNEYLTDDEKQMENIEIYSINRHFLSTFQTELAALFSQLSNCLSLWSSHFALTQTRFHRFFSDCTCSRMKLAESDLLKHEQHLVELHQTAQRLQNQHQDAMHRILEHYLDRLTQGDTLSTFLPYANSNDNDLILIGIWAMYFSTNELTRAAASLGTSIHNILELETTHRYASY